MRFGVALVLAQAATVPIGTSATMWWAATRSRYNETSGVLFLGGADVILGLLIIASGSIWGAFHMGALVGGFVIGLGVQATGDVFWKTALVTSVTPNINMFLFILAPLSGVFLNRQKTRTPN